MSSPGMAKTARAPCVRPRRTRRRASRGARLSLCVAALVALVAGASHAATYKWVDDKGVIHYSDKMPPDAVNRGNVELSKDGVPLRKVEPALTPEQRRAREQEEERKRQLARQQEEIDRRDRALLASYASEGEIDLARSRALGTIDAVLESTSAYTEQLRRRRAELATKIAALKNRPVPPVLSREMEGIDEELERQAGVVVQKRREIAAVNTRYDADKMRYREISASRPGSEAVPAGVVPRTASNGSPAPPRP